MILAIKSLFVAKFACYSLKNLIVPRFKTHLLFDVKITLCKNGLFLFAKMTYYPVEKITHCKIHSLVASFEVTCGL